MAAPAPPLPPGTAGNLNVKINLNLRAGFNETIKVPGLLRAAVGDQKVIRARALPPDVLLLTALKPGKTLVRAWGSAGEKVFHVDVASAEAIDRSGPEGESNVIRIAVEFIEVSSSAGESLGLKLPEAIQFSASSALQGDALSSAWNYTANATSSRGLFQSLVKKGLAKVLARPELFVRTGEEASFHSGGEYPVAYSTASQGAFHRRVDWKPYGLSLKVRPQSHDRLNIHSEVQLELSELNQANATDGLPSLTRRKLDTKTSSLDGETIVLSGLLRQTKGNTREGIPVLSDIPLLGGLFGQRGETIEDTELFMTVNYSFSTRAKNLRAVRDLEERIRAKDAVGEAW